MRSTPLHLRELGDVVVPGLAGIDRTGVRKLV